MSFSTFLELCADFNEALELNNWVSNETWYTDQYLQHFHVSPTGSSPPPSQAPEILMSPGVKAVGNTTPEEDTQGLMFLSSKDKKEIIAYLSNGNSLEDAERKYNIPSATIQAWFSQKSSYLTDVIKNEVNGEAQQELLPQSRSTRYESAFSRPVTASTGGSYKKSAFCKTPR